MTWVMTYQYGSNSNVCTCALIYLHISIGIPNAVLHCTEIPDGQLTVRATCYFLEKQAVPVLSCPHHRDTLKHGCMGPSCFITTPHHSDSFITADQFGHLSLTVPGKILPFITTWMPHLLLLTYSPCLP